MKSPLLFAAENGHASSINAIIENDADLFYCDVNGHSAIQLAQMGGHNKAVEILMSSIGRNLKISKICIFSPT